MNQTPCEDKLFIAYAKKFDMANANIPVLIPQAWIQWHSILKRYLNSSNALEAKDIYRVDFVAFWNNQRFAIQVDDISHYASKKNDVWLADEASYLKTLRDERDLRHERWQVFRVSNYEIKDDELVGAGSKRLEILYRFLT